MNVAELYPKKVKGSTNMAQVRASGHDEIMATLARLRRDGVKIYSIEYDRKELAVMVITTL